MAKMLTKRIYMSKIHLNQSITYLLTEKKVKIKHKKIQRYFLIIHKNLKDYNPKKKSVHIVG